MINGVNTYSNANQLKIYHQKPTPQPSLDTPQKTDNKLKKIEPYKASIFYIADVHGKMTNMERIWTVSRNFDNMPVSKDTAKLKLSSGDILLGSNPMTNQVASDFLNWIGVTANALGNHELDATPAAFSKTLQNANYSLLAVNTEVNPQSEMYGKIKKSIIEEHNGQKYGIIGTAPSDVLERVGTRESLDDIKVDNVETTIKKIQDEVNKLEAQGVNKIILISHSGKDVDKTIAENTSGLDIILGAHTHDLYKGVKEKDNLLYSKDGKPVVLTQIGKDGEYAGVLNVEFDDKGYLVKLQNNVFRTGGFNRTLPMKTAVENIIGKPEVLGKISYADPAPKHRLIVNNPHGNIIVDAIKKELDTDIAILNAGNIRGYFTEGEVDSRRINDVTPFEDKMMICSLTEKQIVDAIKHGGKSFLKTDNKPGILLVSGLNYTMDDKGKLLNLTYIDKAGVRHSIDVDNPRTDKKYTVGCDDFFAYGGDDYLPVNPNPDYVLKKFDVDKNVYTAKYIKELNTPIEIKDDGRIKIVKAN